jgi:hypothetical protein
MFNVRILQHHNRRRISHTHIPPSQLTRNGNGEHVDLLAFLLEDQPPRRTRTRQLLSSSLEV